MRNRLIQFGIVLILIVIYVAFIHSNSTVSTTNKHLNNENKPTQYTLENIIKVIGKHHFKLTPVKDKSSDSFQLENVSPRIFLINGDKKHNLFVYVFESVSARKKAVAPYYETYTNIFPNGYVPLGMYETWNVLIMEMEKQPVKETELKKLKQYNLGQIVFKELNHGKIKEFVGETKSWKGKFTLRYYTHQWVDDTGSEKIDQFGAGEVVIHYKSKTGLKNIECIFKNGSSVLKTTVDRLDNNGNITLNVSNADVPNPENLPTITITSDSQVETITLKGL